MILKTSIIFSPFNLFYRVKVYFDSSKIIHIPPRRESVTISYPFAKLDFCSTIKPKDQSQSRTDFFKWISIYTNSGKSTSTFKINFLSTENIGAWETLSRSKTSSTGQKLKFYKSADNLISLGSDIAPAKYWFPRVSGDLSQFCTHPIAIRLPIASLKVCIA